MKKQEDKTTRLILEISNYVHKYGEFPRRGTLSIDGIDMGKAITRARTGELTLTKEQIAILERLDDFLSRTEKNIQELEKFYIEHGHLPLGDVYSKYKDIMWTYKSGKVPITESQRKRLEVIGALLDKTERMVRSIEAFYKENGTLPKRGDKTVEGYDMGNAIIGYRNGKRELTISQMERLKTIGITFLNMKIKAEQVVRTRIISENEKSLSEKIKQLKAERDNLINDSNTIKEKKF